MAEGVQLSLAAEPVPSDLPLPSTQGVRLTGALRELSEEVSISAQPEALSYVGEIVSHVGVTEDRANFFELHCESAVPGFRVDGREVVWAGFLSPDELLAAGTVDVVRQYLERIAARAGEP